jgi:hypothetical protein
MFLKGANYHDGGRFILAIKCSITETAVRLIHFEIQPAGCVLDHVLTC